MHGMHDIRSVNIEYSDIISSDNISTALKRRTGTVQCDVVARHPHNDEYKPVTIVELHRWRAVVVLWLARRVANYLGSGEHRRR